MSATEKRRAATGQASLAEKRRAPRRGHDSVLEIFDESGHFITGVGRLVNFSAVGACFATTKKLSPEEPLRVRLRMLKEGKLEAKARVVWSRRKTNAILYGIAFEKVQKISP
jgi:hypothetical protein